MDYLNMFLFHQMDRARLDRMAERLLASRDDTEDMAPASRLELLEGAYDPTVHGPSTGWRGPAHTASMDTACSNAVEVADASVNGTQSSPSTLIPHAAYTVAPTELRAVLDDSARRDPFDLTGAKTSYARAIARYKEKNREIHWPTLHRRTENLAADLAEGTLASAASHLRALHGWMHTNHIPTDEPFDPEDLHDYFGWLTDRGRLDDGEPLQHGTVLNIQSAIYALCRARGWANPFEADPVLAQHIKGYGRLYGRVELRAHAVRVSELARMIRSAIAKPADPYEVARDRAIVALCVGPNRIPFRAAHELQWHHVVHLPASGVDEPARIILPADPTKRGSTEREWLIPNHSVLVAPADYRKDHEAVVLCGVQAIRSLRAAAIRSGRVDDNGDPTGPVLDKPANKGTVGSGLSHARMSTMVKETWAVASCDGTLFGRPDLTADWDSRYAIARAVGEPSFDELRDAALIAIAWWASLRSDEAAELRWGDISSEKRGRGLIVQVRKSKTDPVGTGQFVAVPHHRIKGEDGMPVPSLLDLGYLLSRYQDAWVRRSGRVPDPDDYVFLGQRTSHLGPAGARGAFVRLATAANVEAGLGERLSFHGLRAGFATTTLIAGMPAEEVARRQRRKTTASLATYFRLADPFAGTLSYIFDFDQLGLSVEEMLQELAI